MENQKCVQCRNEKTMDNFGKKPNGTYVKTCNACKQKSKCEHGKRKSTCKKCAPGNFCEHNVMKYMCKECSPKNFCEHGM